MLPFLTFFTLIHLVNSLEITPFTTKLTIPPVILVKNGQNVTLTLSNCNHLYHPSLNSTSQLCINNVFPGPIIETERYTPLYIHYKNKINLHPLGNYSTNTTIHLHGALSLGGDNDGYPLTPHSQASVQRSWYPNLQPSTLLFYHDHSMNLTARNVYSGLVGGYIIRDEVERKLVELGQIPSSEIPIILSDKSFNDDSSLDYTLSAGIFAGKFMSVNGKIMPYHSIQAGRHRLRILNGCNARFLNISIPNSEMYLIGNEVGLFETGATKISSLMLASGERADIIIDFTQAWKRNITTLEMINTSPVQQPGPVLNPGGPCFQIMQFRLLRPRIPSPIGIPKTSTLEISKNYPSLKQFITPRFNVPAHYLKKYPEIRQKGWKPSTSIITTHRFHFLNLGIRDRLPVHLIDNGTFMDNVEVAKVGTMEKWTVCNTMTIHHPMHIHGVHFRIDSRYKFDSRLFLTTGKLNITGNDLGMDVLEKNGSPREMWISQAGTCTELTVWIGNFRGDFVWHCHLLEHEDGAMMRRFNIGNGYKPGNKVPIIR